MHINQWGKRLRKIRIITWMIVVLCSQSLMSQPKKIQNQFLPAQEWLDHRGKPINAHGGGVLFFNGIYYWYGEHKIEGKSEAELADGGIHCYASTDLINWTDMGLVLSVDYESDKTDLTYGCLIERPKVVHHAKSGKFLAYFKFYPKGFGYEIAYVGVAIAESPTGPFRYSHKFLAAGSPKGSGDFSMYVDEQGHLYHLAVRKPDKAFVMTKMKDDYMLPEQVYQPCLGIEMHTEAPALVKVDGTYYLLGSGSSGWKPNTARAYSSKRLEGPWVLQGNPCVGTNSVHHIGSTQTFGGQSSFVITVQGMRNAYIAMFDIWNPDRAIEGRYIWLPISFANGKMNIQWKDQWTLADFKP